MTALGFEVEVQRFAFDHQALMALPMIGAGLGWLAIILIPLALLPGIPRAAALVAVGGGLAALGVLAHALGSGRIPVGGSRRDDANLIATRAGAAPRIWLVAHYDTKAQGHSMAGRLVAVWFAVVASLGLLGVAFARLGGPVSPVWAGAAAALALLAGVLASRGRLRGRTVGARDNASGVLAVLAAAAGAPEHVGVLITGAEEFGLVGARIFANHRGVLLRQAIVINIDTVDEEGALAVVSHDRDGAAVATRLVTLLHGVAPVVQRRHLPLGIFVDSAVLRRGAAAITIGRLGWATLRRIHTPRDTDFSMETAEALGRRLGSVLSNGKM